jgi:iron(II)-dependent oxidoreductase
MQDLVPVPTAQAFTQVFYKELLEHGLVDLASNVARSTVFSAGYHGAQIPVLFSRLADNRLLDMPTGDRAKTIPTEYFEPETVLIPAGRFTMGSYEPGIPEAETPEHQVKLHAYRIGKYPVTNKQYAEFVGSEGKNVPQEVVGWDGNNPPKDKPKHPVEGVTFHDAVAYCEWLSNEVTKRLGRKRTYRLPTEAEWEKAARGASGRIYPWGDEWPADRCHQDGEESAAVDDYGAQSVYGIYDLVGNVSEWTRTLWGQNPNTPAAEYKHPWKDDARNETTAGNHIRRVVKGGSYGDSPERLRCSARTNELPDKPGLKGNRHGFRVVLAL